MTLNHAGLLACGERVLVRQLRELESDAVLARRALDDARRQVQYRLTSLGRALHEPSEVMRRCGEQHQAGVG